MLIIFPGIVVSVHGECFKAALKLRYAAVSGPDSHETASCSAPSYRLILQQYPAPLSCQVPPMLLVTLSIVKSLPPTPRIHYKGGFVSPAELASALLFANGCHPRTRPALQLRLTMGWQWLRTLSRRSRSSRPRADIVSAAVTGYLVTVPRTGPLGVAPFLAGDLLGFRR